MASIRSGSDLDRFQICNLRLSIEVFLEHYDWKLLYLQGPGSLDLFQYVDPTVAFKLKSERLVHWENMIDLVQSKKLHSMQVLRCESSFFAQITDHYAH